MTRSFLTFLLPLAIAVSLSAVAVAQEANSPNTAQARAACAQSGLNPSEAAFTYCVASLRSSAAATQAVARMERSRDSCAQSGLQSGTPAFANCTLDREGAMRAAGEKPIQSANQSHY
jgi:hypothetical protein